MTEQHSVPHPNYFLIFIALCVLTILSVIADVVHIPSKALLAVIVLAVATAKALFVMAYFMHLKFEGKWKYVLLSPTIVLAMGIPLAIAPDISLHYYPVRIPQAQEVAREPRTAHEPAGRNEQAEENSSTGRETPDPSPR